MSETLKPCPFCGGGAEIEESDRGYAIVFCGECGCFPAGAEAATRETAIAEWNHRAPAAEQEPFAWARDKDVADVQAGEADVRSVMLAPKHSTVWCVPLYAGSPVPAEQEPESEQGERFEGAGNVFEGEAWFTHRSPLPNERRATLVLHPGQPEGDKTP